MDLAMTGKKKPKTDILFYLTRKGLSLHDAKDPSLASKIKSGMAVPVAAAVPSDHHPHPGTVARARPVSPVLGTAVHGVDIGATATTNNSKSDATIDEDEPKGVEDPCALCCGAPRDCVLIPCGHRICCSATCGEQIRSARVRCARSRARSVLRVYRTQ
jgi:hypothetical protein